jgi:signal peptidase II
MRDANHIGYRVCLQLRLEGIKMRAKISRSFLWLALAVLASIILDQSTKVHAEQNLKVWDDPVDATAYRGRRVPLGAFGDQQDPTGKANYIALNLNYVRNQGAAWGMLSDAKDHFRVPFFFIITIVAMVAIAFYFKATPPHHRLARYALALVFSGAVGNFIDRVRLGYVIDWIDVHWNVFGWQYYFPNFNVADSAISVGVALLLVDTILLERQRQKQSSN